MAFSDLLENLKRPFEPKPQSVVGIDVGSSSIKVVQVKNDRGAVVLETYGELALGPYAGTEIGRATNLPQEKLEEALADVLKESNVTTKAAAFAIPFSSSLVTLIELPPVSEKQLASLIPIEARKYIPVPISEVALDWFVVPPDPREEGKEPKTQVLVVAIHNEVIRRYGALGASAGLDTSFLEIEAFSTSRAVLDRGIAPVMVMDLGAATTKLYIVEHGIVRESHIVNKGAQEITLSISSSLGVSVEKAEELKRAWNPAVPEVARAHSASLLTLDYIFSEANRILLNYQARRNKNVGTVVLTGGGSALAGLLERAKEKFGTEVVRGNPFGKTRAPAFLEEVLRNVGPSFAVAVGVALRRLQEANA